MSPWASQLLLLGIVGLPLAFGIWLDRHLARTAEDARARRQIHAVTAKRADEEGEPLAAGELDDYQLLYADLFPGRCRAIVAENRCRLDTTTGDLCHIHWKMAGQGYPTRTDAAAV